MNENINTLLLQALFSNYKKQLFLIYQANPEILSKSFLYAISNDIYPLFNESKDIQLYESLFKTDKNMVTTIIRFIDEMWLNKEYITFYKLEEKFGRGKRYEIYNILRYCFLDGRFDENLFNDIKKEAPAECKNFDKAFELKELYQLLD